MQKKESVVTSKAVIQLEKQLLDDREYVHPKKRVRNVIGRNRAVKIAKFYLHRLSGY